MIVLGRVPIVEPELRCFGVKSFRQFLYRDTGDECTKQMKEQPILDHQMPTEPIPPLGADSPEYAAEQFSADHLERSSGLVDHYMQDPLRTDQWRNGPKRLTSVGRMVEDAPTDDEIELLRLEGKLK